MINNILIEGEKGIRHRMNQGKAENKEAPSNKVISTQSHNLSSKDYGFSWLSFPPSCLLDIMRAMLGILWIRFLGRECSPSFLLGGINE